MLVLTSVCLLEHQISYTQCVKQENRASYGTQIKVYVSLNHTFTGRVKLSDAKLVPTTLYVESCVMYVESLRYREARTILVIAKVRV